MKGWLNRVHDRYGSWSSVETLDLRATDTLLNWGTISMLMNYYGHMVESIKSGKTPNTGIWTFACQFKSVRNLRNFIQDREPVSLVCDDRNMFIGPDDPESTRKRDDEFFFTIVVGKGSTIQHKLISRVPKEFDKFVTGELRSFVQRRIDQRREDAERRLGKQQQTIMSEHSALKEMRGECNVCSETKGASRCAGCGRVFYCGKEHQKLDWPSHKVACKLMRGYRQGKNVDEVAREENISDVDRLLSQAGASLEQMSLQDGSQATVLQFRR